MSNLERHLERILSTIGLSGDSLEYWRFLMLAVLLMLVSYTAFRLTKSYIIGLLYAVFKRTAFTWDDVLVDRNALNSMAHIVPAVLIKAAVPLLFRDFEALIPFAGKLANCYLLVVGMGVVISFVSTVEYILSQSVVFAEKPVSSYFQLVRMVIYIITFILVLSELLNKTPVYFLSAFGAMTAVLLLIFKDTIMGLVASVQISANEMVRVGDWVEMPKFNADGDVIAINLYTVKIRNWDKTITTVPTYYFITDSFKNWRGMHESGGRRIKRSLYINVNSVRFVDPLTREQYKKYFLIKDFIASRQLEIDAFNAQHDVDTSQLINGRRMTNIGVFRNYAQAYLTSHPLIRQDMTLLVRQLAMEDRGLPLEVYCFTATTKWRDYEEIQSNIFDHLIAAAGFFDLELFQQPSGRDFSNRFKTPPEARAETAG